MTKDDMDRLEAEVRKNMCFDPYPTVRAEQLLTLITLARAGMFFARQPVHPAVELSIVPDIAKAFTDAATYGQGAMQGGKRIDPADFYMPPEIDTILAGIIRETANDVHCRGRRLAAQLRRVASSKKTFQQVAHDLARALLAAAEREAAAQTTSHDAPADKLTD